LGNAVKKKLDSIFFFLYKWDKMKLEFTEQEIKDMMSEIDMAYSGGGFSSITQEIIAKKIKEELKKKKA